MYAKGKGIVHRHAHSTLHVTLYGDWLGEEAERCN